jgi:HEAT repeat protein
MRATRQKLLDNRRNRGQVTREEIDRYTQLSTGELAGLLGSALPRERTLAATIIGQKKLAGLIPSLCQALAGEKQLYCRMAMAEALGKMGKQAVKPLVELLGKIGSNQERALPVNYFNKKSYPLARDIAARTLTKIGRPAIPALLEKIGSSSEFAAQQALDALGGIADRTGDYSALPTIITALGRCQDSAITTWKIVRALSGFKTPAAIEPLISLALRRPEAAIRWEAIRSLGQIGIAADQVMNSINTFVSDPQPEVRLAAQVAMARLAPNKSG